MNNRNLLTVFAFIFILSGIQSFKAQNNCVAIAINEYCPSNIPGSGYPDAFGELSDWVEIKCNFSSSVTLAGYYLSNDRNNLYKWKFPTDKPLVLGTDEVKLVWLSGRNTVVTNSLGENEYHANFTLEQCKDQWIILTTGTGVIRDSVFVRATKGGDSWGRIDCFGTGAGSFRLYQGLNKSPNSANGVNNFLGYAPKPKLIVGNATNFNDKINKGGFYAETPQLAYFKFDGRTYDTASTCYDIFYTRDGSYPVPGYPAVMPTEQYIDSLLPITISKTEVIRFIAVPRPNTAACALSNTMLPSFCESNTYFMDQDHQEFSADFGVVSVSLDDVNWFDANGTSAASVHIEYYDKENQVSEGYAQINRPVQEAWLTEQKGFYFSIDDRFGSGCNVEGPVFNVEGLGTSSRTVFPTLHLKGGDFESHSKPGGATDNKSIGTGIRDVFMQSLAAKNNLNVNPLHIKPVVAFINGEYAGVFDLREVFDKYYENFYNGQPLDSLDMNLVHQFEGHPQTWDNTIATTPFNDWRSGVYDVVINNPMNAGAKYTQVMDQLDKASFIDYMILNSYAQNQDLFKFNVAFARGRDKTKPGYKWHYYLWNMPSTYNFTDLTNPGVTVFPNPASPAPCYITSGVTGVQPKAFDGHKNMLVMLMGRWPGKTTWGNAQFRLEYENRFQDLLNGPLKCDNILKHYDYVVELFRKEMLCHEDPACQAEGLYHTVVDNWDTNVVRLRRGIEARCYASETQYGPGSGCSPLKTGPFNVSVDVFPQGAGQVKINSMVLDNYKWFGKYYQTTMSFKALPTSENFVFHHWELQGPAANLPLELDSISMNLNGPADLVAVFTDKRNEIIATGEGATVPTGFTPNGDGINDIFRPLGSAEFMNEFSMTVWNRWGQEVFRSSDARSGWDGYFKGTQAQTGVYAFVITYNNIDNEPKVVKGNVTLTR